jgi:hypothetical protein
MQQMTGSHIDVIVSIPANSPYEGVGMKLSIRAMLIGVAALICAYVAYSKRFEISARVWRWRNGDFAHVGNYMIPVPDRWLVKVEPSGMTFLTDARNRRNISALSGVNVITVDSISTSTGNLDSWKSFKEQWLKTNGIRNPELRTLKFEDEVLVCLGGQELRDVMQLPNTSEVFSVDCRSSGRLHLMFVGQRPDLELFYSLVPRIHTQK